MYKLVFPVQFILEIAHLIAFYLKKKQTKPKAPTKKPTNKQNPTKPKHVSERT